MAVAISTAVETLLAQCNLVDPQLEQIQGGRNSRVWRVDSLSGAYIVKEYFRHPADSRDRLGTEYGFLTFLQTQGLTTVPEPLGKDPEGNVALYSYLPGTPVTHIQADHIQQSARFIQQINQRLEGSLADNLPPASEACFSMAEHLQRVKQRLNGLKAALDAITEPLHITTRQFLTDQLLPTYEQVNQQICSSLSAAELSRPLEKDQRILSPSDFGFHNILQVEGQLYFLDFEYAGWDDPAKLLCDFASQPQCPVSQAQAQAFGAHLRGLKAVAQAQDRVQYLLPLYRLKWCCILLNEFRSQDRQRRHHAGDHQADKLTVQFQKAKTYFHQHLRDSEWL
jgi:hypothetical protein